ncbi:MAG: histidine kinase [Clostridiales bacterium]|nr:histidine kinase [Clostridiales bacterium]
MNKRRWTFQNQALCIFLFTFSVLFLVNLYIYSNMNTIIENVDKTYVGNKNLMELRENLDEIQSCVTEYLNTRSEDALNQFYKREEEYKELLKTLNSDVVDSENLIMEKNIRNMSESYLIIVNRALIAKPGRDIEGYMTYNEQASELFDYLVTCINNLNSTLFRNNSDTYAQLLDSVHFTEMMYSIILMVTGFLNVCLIIVLIRRMTKPLKELAETAKEVGKGNLEVQLIESNNQTEIGIVIRAFNQMVRSLKEYIEKLRQSVEAESALRENAIRMEAYLKDAQLKYLQAQINPHFLFNTLNAGAQLAMLEDADKTYRYIHKVADFFRFMVKKNDALSTIQEEIELVDNYIYILNVRYAGEIHYDKQVEKELLNISVPSMILQPIVENCIKHGLHDIGWEKRIKLSVVKESDYVVVSVIDNGIGMTKKQIETILNNTELEKPDGEAARGIGLDNVITRLRTFYNCENVVEITSVGKDMGTEVAIYIPAAQKENDNV